MKDILKINRAKWRTGRESKNKTGKGDTMLLNDMGYMCCLGFRCNQLGIPKKDLLGVGTPDDSGWKVIPDLVDEHGNNNSFCSIAMNLNDDVRLTSKRRESKLIKHFAKVKTKVVFVGKYKKAEQRTEP